VRPTYVPGKKNTHQRKKRKEKGKLSLPSWEEDDEPYDLGGKLPRRNHHPFNDRKVTMSKEEKKTRVKVLIFQT